MPDARDPLARYNQLRDFARTAEPAGTLAPGKGNLFCVQKHDATRLHWDLRLEAGGVLKSWAVTRGPSLNPDDKRLAVRTEDHPVDYGDFEGTIPAGEYGGGTVMLWDRGTWSPVAGKSAADIDAGHLHFIVRGERMRGEWMLIRLKPRGKEKRENWLLRKIADADAGGSDTLVETALTSVKTGRTMAEIAEGRAVPRYGSKSGSTPRPRRAAGKAAALPDFRPPQLCTLVDAVPAGSGWLHEMKYDGYRAIVGLGGGKARIFTRSGLDWTDKFAGIAEACAALPASSALIDGEIVAFKDGRPDFSTLKTAIAEGGAMTLFAFDLLSLEGEDLTAAPLVDRKQRLRAILPDGDERLRFADHIAGSGEALLADMCEAGVEGIVSKRADAPYRGGRSTAWLKIKCTHRQEFVIIGWRASEKGRGFASLLLGVHEDGALRYAGKVGTGFDQAAQAAIGARLARTERKTPPVAVPRAAARGAHWVTPQLVAEVAFAEWTPDKVLRHASFIGLREDKPAAEVRIEAPAPPPAAPAIDATVTHPERLLFADSTVTKGELAGYYARLSPLLLAHAARRPISLVRCPQGRSRKCFFQKHDAGSFGEAVHQVDIREKDGGTEPYLYVDDAAGLVACVQMGTIEFHGWGSRIDAIERPDRLVFDLDPDEALGFAEVKSASLFLKDQLAELGLVSFALLSGGKGVHVVVPLLADAEWPAAKSFAHRFAEALAQAHPDRFTATMSKAKRRGRIFIDWLRNQRGSTVVMPYSARARPGAPVAAPVSWAELRDIETPARFTVCDADLLLARADGPDLRGWGIAAQKLPEF